MITRRAFLASSASALGGALIWPQLTFASTGVDTRFLVVMLRGGLDGLHAVQPYADPAYAALRGALNDGADAPTKLDAQFALHPSLSYAAQLYHDGAFLPIVATAPPYWGRSHFDAQDCVENGTDRPHGAQQGWLNRCVAALPGAHGLAAAVVMPLMMRGAASIDTWSPPLPRRLDPVLLQRLEMLYAADARLDPVFRRAIASDTGVDPQSGQTQPGTAAIGAMDTAAKPAGRLAQTMAAVGAFMGKADGPRLAFVEDSGWDTHANEAAILARKLRELDEGLRAFHAAEAALWPKTVIAIVTEFGRTAAVNGTGGTDHGSGGVMFLAGGAVRGGRVAGDWPGVAPAQLYQQRDVHATTDLRAVFKGVLRAHLGVSDVALATRVFPDSSRVRPFENLSRAG